MPLSSPFQGAYSVRITRLDSLDLLPAAFATVLLASARLAELVGTTAGVVATTALRALTDGCIARQILALTAAHGFFPFLDL